MFSRSQKRERSLETICYGGGGPGGSGGVCATGTAEPNPTTPAGGIKPRINDGGDGAPLAGDKTMS